ncbi:MAG: APC family permease [Candidatus Sericytochromatia bacterium]|nr:APC family permease [Candidatus Sericytochromatia bacterium]
MPNFVKRTLVGNPLATAALAHQRLTKLKALAVLSSDALSSVAYATEEIILVLSSVAVAGAANFSMGIAAAITLLLLIVGLSYRQTIYAYPNGGGSYIVAKENLGARAGLVAAAALMIDYVLTVAVSIAAGVENLASALPAMHGHNAFYCLLFIVLLTLINLRGVKESASIFAAPTYFFIGSIVLMLGVGGYRYLMGTLPTVASVATPAISSIGWFVILRAFSSGCTAMTGVEAISNGIPAFEKPESRNASVTLGWLVAILAVMFIGITALGHVMGVGAAENQTYLAQVSRGVFNGGPLFYMVQFATMAILVLAANTSYADFPRLSSLIARDGYLPRQLTGLGDRLVFSNGIILLGAASFLLTALFQGDTHALIPLYAVGVFLSFTLSQSGMVVHWWRLRAQTPGFAGKIGINALGAVVTAVVTVIIAGTKFLTGAWIVIGLIPLFVLLFTKIHSHYAHTNAQLSLAGIDPQAEAGQQVDSTVLLLVSTVHRGVLGAMRYVRTLGPDVRAVYIDLNGDGAARIADIWHQWGQGMPLVVLDSPYRSVTEPLITYIGKLQTDPDRIVTVVIPEFVTHRWWENALHNQTAFLIKWALLFCRRRVVVTSVPQFLD